MQHTDLEDLLTGDWSGERGVVATRSGRSISDAFKDVVTALRAAEVRRYLRHAKDTTAAAQLDKLLAEHARTRDSSYDTARRRRRPPPSADKE